MDENALRKEQERIEHDMVSRGRDRFETLRRAAESNKEALRSKTYRVVLDAALEPLSAAISAFLTDSLSKKAGRRLRSSVFMADLPPEALAYITLSLVVSSAPRGPLRLTDTAVRVGRAVEVETQFIELETNAPGLAWHHRKLLREASTDAHRQIVAKHLAGKRERRGDREAWAVTDRLAVGLKLIELLIVSTGLFHVRKERKGVKTTDTLVPAKAFTDWVEEISSELADLFPTYLPTVIPPRDWTGLYEGGYHTDALRVPPSLVKTSSADHRRLLRKADLSLVMAAVNAIQRTPWRVNRRVLQVAEMLVATGQEIAGLPSLEKLPIPTSPADFNADPAETRRWKAEAARTYAINAKASAKRLAVLNALSLAGEFGAYERIYFPHQLDFRGRAYPLPSALNPQGSDLHKGLLHFADGAPLGTLEGARHFEVQGANLYGIDKVSISDRLLWVSQNADHILASAQRPLDYTWWQGADEPFGFLAWCYEWAEWQEGGFDLDYVSRLPRAMDGSCNGIQHYSALLLDPAGGRATNLLPGDHPEDFYRLVAERLVVLLRECPDPLAALWLRVDIDRSMVKPPCIAFVFGGTAEGIYSGLMDHVTALPPGSLPFPSEALPEAVRFLAKVTLSAIEEVGQGAAAAMTWLREVARRRAQEQLPLTWTTPTGFVVYQGRVKSRLKQIELVMFGRRIRPAIREDLKEIDGRRQAAAFPPNYIHSLDAAHMMLTVISAERAGITQFAMIHDSFGCPAGQAEEMGRMLREEFVRLYEDEPLKRLAEEVSSGLSRPLPAPPRIGGLDLQEVLRADYFFA